MGVIANNPMHLGGAVDSDAADKAARFMQLCDGARTARYCRLMTTPAIWSGRKRKKRRSCATAAGSYLIGANITVPLFFVIIRKAIGLGKLAMTGGGMKKGKSSPSAWPTGEFAGMGIEGQVKLGRQKELAAISGSGRAHCRLRALGGRALRDRKSTQYRLAFPGRRRHRPRRHAALDQPRPAFARASPGTPRQKAPVD